MKRTKHDEENPYCSCTSCIYNNDSDRPSLKRLSKTSRIDRLQRSIPHKERKLLEKLVRTRAVYDGLRAQLISDSTLSSIDKADFNPLRKQHGREIQYQKGSPILELVNLVDKGVDLDSKLSECCSCCICSSKSHAPAHYDHINKRRRLMLKRKIRREKVQKYEHTRQKFGDEHRRKRGVRFKPKFIKSEPCTCVLKFRDVIKSQSKSFLKKLKNDHSAPELGLVKSRQMITRRFKNIGDSVKSSYENINVHIKHTNQTVKKSLQVATKKSLGKLKSIKNKQKQNDCECFESEEKVIENTLPIRHGNENIEENVQLAGRKSLEKIKVARDKLRHAIKTEATAFVETGNNIAAKIKKDSLLKFIDDIRKKQSLEDWTCDPACLTGICEPEECFQKLKDKNYRKYMNENYKKPKTTEQSESKSDSNVRPQTNLVTVKTGTVRQNISSSARQTKNKVDCRCVGFNTNPKVKHETVKVDIGALQYDNSKSQKEKKSRPMFDKNVDNIETIRKQKSVSKQMSKNEKDKLKQRMKSVKEKDKAKPRQVVRISSSFEFSVEFGKEKPDILTVPLSNREVLKPSNIIQLQQGNQNFSKPTKHKISKREQVTQVEVKRSSKDSQFTSHSLKRCFCTLKLKPKRFRKFRSKSLKSGASTDASCSSKNYFNLECKIDPSRCKNKVCNPIRCQSNTIKNAKHVGTNTDLNVKNFVKLSKSGRNKKAEILRTRNRLQPYECEPGICFPGDCNPQDCFQIINMREKRKKLKTSSSNTEKKSTSSLSLGYTSKPRETQSFAFDKNATESIRHTVKPKKYTPKPKRHQAVTIGSSFSFNIEFHKNLEPSTPEVTPVKMISLEPKVRLLKPTHKQKQIKMSKKTTSTEMHKKKPNVKLGNLKRCFCTLKLRHKSISKKEFKMFSVGADTNEPGYSVQLLSKSTKINSKHMNLAHFECEPNTCVPGECDLYECLEKIKKRNRELKSIALATTLPEKKSVSSTTGIDKRNRSVVTQYKPIREKHPASGDSSDVKNRQAVRLGSTFSFNIEFSKSQSHVMPYENNRNLSKDRNDVRNTKKVLKNKGINYYLPNVSIETQAETEKRTKALSVKPMLKRCFCTLNLVKKQNHQFRSNYEKNLKKKNVSPVIYRVNEIVTRNWFERYTHQSKISFCQNYLNLKTANTDSIIPRKIKSQVSRSRKSISSTLSITLSNVTNAMIPYPIQIGISNNLKKITKATKEINAVNNCRRALISNSSVLRDNKMFREHDYFKRCFCTMNISTKNLHTPHKGHAFPSEKLKPYECEPGICVPGQCDPYVCEKLIMKRLKRRTAKKSGTESTSKSTFSHTRPYVSSVSSITDNSFDKTRSSHQVHHESKHKSKDKSRIQGVRIGSSFSFDIEFTKNKTKSSIKSIEPKHSSDTKLVKRVMQNRKKDKITHKNKTKSINQGSQSHLFMVHKGSDTSPVTQRCFCTLKLQKQGRLHKNTNMDIQSKHIDFKTRGQNTAKVKPVKLVSHLKTYECEPGICIPDQCDAFKCLEIIKNRLKSQERYAGTNTIYSRHSVSVSTKNRLLQKRHRGINAKSKAVDAKIKRNKDISKRVASHQKYKDNKVVTKPSQVISIGSNFSFNLEFYKEKPELQIWKENREAVSIARRNVPVNQKQKIVQRSSQIETDLKLHKESQIKSYSTPRSTMTDTILKRCFCTAKLKAGTRSHSKHPMKSANEKQNSNKVVIKPEKPSMANKKINTRSKYLMHHLEPNECLPGMCIPGECDPYKCYEIMNRKRIKTNSKYSLTDSVKTRSLGNYNRGKFIKNRNTQFKLTKFPKTVDYKSRINKTRYNSQQINGSKKQAVKIGSSFSFDVEFFKQKSVTSPNDNEIFSKVKQAVNQQTNKSNKIEREVKHKGSASRSVAFTSSPTQAESIRKKNTAVGVKSMLKRCFCVLKLQNKGQHSRKELKVKKVKPKPRNLSTKGMMTTEREKKYPRQLLPYECEPGVCIPYECDPIACDKIIKQRLNRKHFRESGTVTEIRKMSSSISTYVHMSPKTKNRYTLKKQREDIVEYKPKEVKLEEKSNDHHGQSVKIGSSFNFDIEFFKDKSGLKATNLPRRNEGKSKRLHIHEFTTPNPKHISSQNHKNLRDEKIQPGAELSLTESTMTRNLPFSNNRCFCTLYLNKSNQQKVSQLQHIKATGSRDASIEANVKLPKLELSQYECEPNTCIPGKCNPLNCFERIKLRELNTRNIGLITGQKTKSVGTVVNTKFKNRKLLSKTRKQSELLAYPKSSNDNLNSSKKQVVRIGSNFSFDIEFYKDKIMDQILIEKSIEDSTDNKRTRIKKIPIKRSTYKDNTQILKNATLSVKSGFPKLIKRCFCTLKSLNNNVDMKNKPKQSQPILSPNSRKIQNVSNLTQTKKELNIKKYKDIKSKKKSTKSISKTCLCTLKPNDSLQRHEIDLPQQSVATNNKGVTAKMTSPYLSYLEPYKCEPYTCIPGKCDPDECDKRIKLRKFKHSKNNATQIRHYRPKSLGINTERSKMLKNQFNVVEPSQPKIVEVPRFSGIGGRNTVRIGSNFSFNIEFYKESITPQMASAEIIKGTKDILQAKAIDTVDKNVVTNMGLKKNRKLQGTPIKQETKASDTDKILKRCFCTLGRNETDFLKENKKKPGFPISTNNNFPQAFEVRRVTIEKNSGQMKKKMLQTKSVATNVSEKYLNNCDCPNNKTGNMQDVKTILPYAPYKFNKSFSKTLLSKKDTPSQNYAPRNPVIDRRKRQIRKQSLRFLNDTQNQSAFKVKDINHSKYEQKSIWYKCISVFKKRSPIKKNTDLTENAVVAICFPSTCKYALSNHRSELTMSKSNRVTEPFHNKRKNTKITKSSNIRKRRESHIDDDRSVQKKLLTRTQRGDTKLQNTISKANKNKQNIDDICPIADSKICTHCRTEISKRKQVRFVDSLTLHNPKKLNKIDKTTKHISRSCNCCDLCGRNIDKDEFFKAAGDLTHIYNSTKHVISDGLVLAGNKLKQLFEFDFGEKENVCSGDEFREPLFDVELDSQNYAILNQDDVARNLAKMKRKMLKEKSKTKKKDGHHTESCQCCICVSMRQKDKARISKSARKVVLLSAQKRGPCICGSSICAKSLKEMSRAHKRMKSRTLYKPCVCGSPVCESESKQFNVFSTDPDRQMKEIARRAKKKKREEAESRERRIRKYKDEDALLTSQRIKADKTEEKYTKSTADKGSDIIRLVESFVDIGKMGYRSGKDVVRCAARAVTDPKAMYLMAQEPGLFSAKSKYVYCGIASACRRFKIRWGSSNIYKILRRFMLRNAVTRYIVTSVARNKKIKLPPEERERERFDFSCSLYMATLRKRPFLWVYDCCPWFYPHWMSLVNVWRQFTDVILFLLAAVFWSPCILGVELCRALMCCLVCTG